MGHPSALPLHHRVHRYLNFPSYLWVHLVSQCLLPFYFIFSSKILPINLLKYSLGDSIPITPQHTKSIHNNYTLRIETSSTTFRTFSRYSKLIDLKYLVVTRYTKFFIIYRGIDNFETFMSIMTYHFFRLNFAKY